MQPDHPAKLSRRRLLGLGAGAAALASTPALQPRPAAALPPGPVPIPGAWRLSFSESFASLDPERWRTADAPGGPWPSSGTAQPEDVPTDPAAARIVDGRLALTLTPETGSAGAVLSTAGLWGQVYGFWQARLRIPAGVRAGFRALEVPHLISSGIRVPQVDSIRDPDDVSHERLPQLDIAETTGEPDASVRFGLRYFDPAGQAPARSNPLDLVTADRSGDWHSYAVHWTPQAIRPYVDGLPGAAYAGPGIPQTPMYPVFTASTLPGVRLVAPVIVFVDWLRIWTDGTVPTPQPRLASR